MKTLIIGDTSPDLAAWAADQVGASTLLDNSNIDGHCDGVWHTGLGDLDFNQIKNLALSSDRIVFARDLPWHDRRAWNSTLTLLNYISHFKPIENYAPNPPTLYLTKPVDRHSDRPTLWTFGCSTTAGVGLDDPENECYGRLVADHMGLAHRNVAQSGSSVRWALSHLMQADIHPGDFVIWGTTTAERMRRARSYDEIENTQLAHGSRLEIEYHSDHQVYFDHIDYINMGLRYLRARQIRFVFIGLIFDRRVPYDQRLEIEFSSNPEWVPVLDWHEIDRGNDNLHIGPLGHKYLAQRICDHVKLKGYV